MNSNENAGFAEDPAIRPLHDCACYFISIVHAGLERLTLFFPFPIGFLILVARHLLGPFTRLFQRCSLRIIASFDDQLFALVEGCGLCSKAELRAVLSPLYAHGFVGASARLWLQYKGAMTEEVHKARRLVNRVPIINLVTSLLLYIINPLVRAISDWLTKRGDSIPGVSTCTGDDPFPFILKNVDPMSTMGSLRGGYEQYEHPLEGTVNVDDVKNDCGLYPKNLRIVVGSDGKLVKVDDALHADKKTNMNENSKDDVPITEEDENKSEEFFELIDSSAKGVVVADRCVSVNEPNTGHSQVAERKIDYMPDILEMLESSWHMGTQSFKDTSSWSQKDPS